MKNFKKHALALGLMLSSSVTLAQSIAITNATVHTATDQGVLNNAVVVVKDGVISAINPATVEADTIVDAKGQSLTPGFIAAFNRLGLVEVSAVKATNDSGDKKANVTFDPSLAFNPKTSVIPYSRKGGITTSIISPSQAKDIFKGQTAYVDLSGEFDSVITANQAVLVEVGARSQGSRATSFQKLINKLEDRKKAIEKAAKKKSDDKKGKKNTKEPKREDKIIDQVLAGEKVLVLNSSRSQDILHLLKLKQKFGLKLAIYSRTLSTVDIADQLAEAKVPVIFNPTNNLPRSFDTLDANLANAAKMIAKGVKVMFVEGDTHNMYQLRFIAGNAVSYGVSKADALKAVTANIADTFSLNAGTIEVGKRADLVLWQGDMFDFSGYVDKIWIGGKAYSTEARQDKLRDRYMKKSDMPEAYTK